MTDPFLLRALAAGMGVALMTGPLGCFIAWQRLTYFGDTIAHAALLGVVLALLGGLPPFLGIAAVAAAVSLAVFHLEKSRAHAFDTLLGMAAHGALALGLVLISLSRRVTVDVNALLFGDILAVGEADIAWIYVMAFGCVGLLIGCWRPLMRLTLHPDIARVENVPVDRLRLCLMLAIALSVAASVKVVGLLLITSLLIVPAAAARCVSTTPTQMAIRASLAGMLSVGAGLWASMRWDTPSGPSIILAAIGVFALARCFRRPA